MEKISLKDVKIDPAWSLKISATLALRKQILPICKVADKIVVAMSTDRDKATLDMVSQTVGLEVELVLVDEQELRTELLKVYGDGSTSTARVQDGPVGLVEDIMRAAVLRQASDIHIDPNRQGLRVRMRVDGILEDFMQIDKEMQAGVCSRVKVLSGLDIAEKRAPQDGGFVWTLPRSFGRAADSYDVRTATLPVLYGERITLRLLEAGKEQLSLTSLGMEEDTLKDFQNVLTHPHGLVLLTGPTGSGKTTTLYASLRYLLDKAPLNILTVEDPVECELDGVAQVEVESSDKVNFSKALRSLLRHDPDVVMIGEIRDSESLDTAVKAALTGHLVLSTLHTNDAVSAITRLEDMGLAPHLIGATLRMSVAQRLVRRLCPHCMESYKITEQEGLSLGRRDIVGNVAYKAKGCIACAGRGYSGRIGLFETVKIDEEVASMISNGAFEKTVLKELLSKGVKTLIDDATRKVLSGKTTISEVVRTVLSY